MIASSEGVILADLFNISTGTLSLPKSRIIPANWMPITDKSDNLSFFAMAAANWETLR